MSHPVQGRALDLPFGLEGARISTSVPDAHDTVLHLFDEHRDGLYRFMRATGTSARDSEDIVQDVFLALFRHLARGGARTNLRGWIFRVAWNLARKRRAREARWTRVLSLGGSRPLRDADPSPEEVLAGAERQSRLRQVVRALPARDRQCLMLRAEGLQYREISHALGISLGTVANALARSLARLHRAEGG